MGGEETSLADPMGYSRRTNYIAATGDEGRGGGNQTAAERVADLLKADEKGLDNAFGSKDTAARKARQQWIPEGWNPKKPGYADAQAMAFHEMPEPIAHGPPVPKPTGAAAEYGWVSHPDPKRLPEASEDEGEARALQGQKIEVGMGKGQFTKDWRAESSRIGRYWNNPDFQLGGNGTWKIKSDRGGSSNPFEVRR